VSTLKITGDSISLSTTDEINTIVGGTGNQVNLNNLGDVSVDTAGISTGDQRVLEWNGSSFDVVDIDVAGNISGDIDLDYQYEIQNAAAIELQGASNQFNIEIRPHAQGAHHYLSLNGVNPGNNRKIGIGFQQSAGGSDYYLGDIHYRKMGSSSDDQFNVIWLDSTNPSSQPSIISATRGGDTIKLNYDKVVNSGNLEFLTKSSAGDISTGKINATVDASATPNTMIMNANHPNTSDTLHNHIQMVQDYGSNNVPDTATGLITFAAKDDTMSTSELVGRLGGEYDTGGDHKFRIDAMDDAGVATSYDFAHSGAVMGAVVRMASYGNTARNALTAQNGDVIYNTDNNRFEFYQNGGWVYYTATSV